MSRPSEILRNEHRQIEHLLHVLGAMGERIERGIPVAEEDLDAVLEVATGLVEEHHHGTEEKVLFPVLMRDIPREGAPIIAELEADQQEARRLVAEMARTAGYAARGDLGSRGRFRRAQRAYVQVLEHRIDRERTNLLPLIDQAIVPAELVEVTRRLENRADTRGTNTQGIIEDHARILQGLKARYTEPGAPFRA